MYISCHCSNVYYFCFSQLCLCVYDASFQLSLVDTIELLVPQVLLMHLWTLSLISGLGTTATVWTVILYHSSFCFCLWKLFHMQAYFYCMLSSVLASTQLAYKLCVCATISLSLFTVLAHWILFQQSFLSDCCSYVRSVCVCVLFCVTRV